MFYKLLFPLKAFWFLFGAHGKCTFFHHESFDYEKPGNHIILPGKWTFFLGLRLKSIVLVQWASVQKITLLAQCARLPWFFTQYAYTIRTLWVLKTVFNRVTKFPSHGISTVQYQKILHSYTAIWLANLIYANNNKVYLSFYVMSQVSYIDTTDAIK